MPVCQKTSRQKGECVEYAACMPPKCGQCLASMRPIWVWVKSGRAGMHNAGVTTGTKRVESGSSAGIIPAFYPSKTNVAVM